MAMPLTCPRGHQWNSDEQPNAKRPSVCPVCGLAPVPAAASFPQTLDYQPNPSEVESPEPGDTASTVASFPRASRNRVDRPAPLLSQHIPGYEILGELGRGGMGVVYKARQTKLNRIVALKMVLAGSYASPAERSRFLAEAEAVARMQHPHIVQIFEISQHSGLPFFSLEFVGGGTLAGKLGGTPLPPREAARLVRVLARAVQYAHEQGVVHRDLKPANV